MFSLLLNRQSPPLPQIMPAFDAIKDIRSRLNPRPALPAADALSFEHPEETFCRRVVGTTTHRTHAARDVVRRQELRTLFQSKLAAVIGSENDGRSVLSQPHRPAHDEAGIQVQQNAEAQPVLVRANIYDVRHTFGIGGGEVLLKMDLCQGWLGPGSVPPPAPPLRHSLLASATPNRSTHWTTHGAVPAAPRPWSFPTYRLQS